MMRLLNFLCLSFFLFLLSSCISPDTPDEKKTLTKEEMVLQGIDSLKAMAKDGDLVTRANDNLVSYHLINFNEQDKSFSHAGIIVTRNGQQYVCHIDANDVKGLDTVRYDPIDSFLNPKQNSLCALFRYDLSETERKNFLNELSGYHARKIHFDRIFDLDTDTLVYCSEMIAKSLTKATNGKISFSPKQVPKQMLTLIGNYFDKDIPAAKAKAIAEKRVYIAIDHLYLVPGCRELKRLKLKYFPGE